MDGGLREKLNLGDGDGDGFRVEDREGEGLRAPGASGRMELGLGEDGSFLDVREGERVPLGVTRGEGLRVRDETRSDLGVSGLLIPGP